MWFFPATELHPGEPFGNKISKKPNSQKIHEQFRPGEILVGWYPPPPIFTDKGLTGGKIRILLDFAAGDPRRWRVEAQARFDIATCE